MDLNRRETAERDFGRGIRKLQARGEREAFASRERRAWISYDSGEEKAGQGVQCELAKCGATTNVDRYHFHRSKKQQTVQPSS